MAILLGMIILSFTLAWFQSASINKINEFSIEVGSADTFELSLDGINYNRRLDISLFNKETIANNEYYDSSVQLKDLASVYETVESDNHTIFKILKPYNPLRDEYTGEPLLQTTSGWDEATKSKVVYNASDGKYYVVSTDDDSFAQYIELDVWVRSDSNLEIYLGDESKVEPITTSNNPDVIPAMYSIETEKAAYTRKDYYYLSNDPNHANELYASIFNHSDGFVYYFLNDSVNSELDFVLKTRVYNIAGIDYTFYYDDEDNVILKSRDEYENEVYQHTKYYLPTENNYLQEAFRTIYEADGSYKYRKYRASDGGSLTESEIDDITR